MLIDTHCHLEFQSFKGDLSSVIEKCKEKGMILNTIGTQMDTSREAVELAIAHDNVYASVGLHPIQSKKVRVEEEETLFVARGEDFDFNFYDALVQKSNKVIAIGETGLDAFHIPQDQPFEKLMDDQWNLFLEHVRLADKHDLPVVIHIRDGARNPDGTPGRNAHEEMLQRLAKLERPERLKAVVHCYSGNWEHAQAYLEYGFYLGFTGVVTFPPKKSDPKAQEDLLEVVEKMPLDRMLIETDAPFLAPNAFRGKRCEPWMVEETARFIAERRSIAFEEVEKATADNARRLFTHIV